MHIIFIKSCRYINNNNNFSKTHKTLHFIIFSHFFLYIWLAWLSRMYLLKILNKTLSLERMGTANIMLRPTIPFVPLTVDVNGRQTKHDLSVQLSFPDNPNVARRCNLQGRAIGCEQTIDSFTYDDKQNYNILDRWYRNYTFTVQNSDGIPYNMPKNYFVLKLKTTSTNGQGDKIFSDVTFHDIKVSRNCILQFIYVFQLIYAIHWWHAGFVTYSIKGLKINMCILQINVTEHEIAWKGKRCSSYADPHQTTFDG